MSHHRLVVDIAVSHVVIYGASDVSSKVLREYSREFRLSPLLLRNRCFQVHAYVSSRQKSLVRWMLSWHVVNFELFWLMDSTRVIIERNLYWSRRNLFYGYRQSVLIQIYEYPSFLEIAPHIAHTPTSSPSNAVILRVSKWNLWVIMIQKETEWWYAMTLLEQALLVIILRSSIADSDVNHWQCSIVRSPICYEINVMANLKTWGL